MACGLVQEQEAVTHHPESRGQLVRASQQLLRFLLAGHTTQTDFMHAETLSHVFKPLVELPDRHLLASAVGLTLALITGRTDLCSAGVFGAGKTLGRLLAKFGRLIGFHEAQKGASARTAIDVRYSVGSR